VVATALLLATAVPATSRAGGDDPLVPGPAPTPLQPVQGCTPAKVPFDPDKLELTGAWSADDGGIYTIRQVGDKLWWDGRSDRLQRNGPAGRDWENVASGTIKNGTIGLDWADVPSSNTLGTGKLLIRPQKDPDGNLQLVAISHPDFGGSVWTPCQPEPEVLDRLAVPMSVSPRFGLPLDRWDGGPEATALYTEPYVGSGMTAWVIGPGWTHVCGASYDATPPTDPAGLLAYLRSRTDLEVTDGPAVVVGGHPAQVVDVKGIKPSADCADGESYFRLWKVSDLEAGLGGTSTSRIVATDVDGQLVVFEIWGDQQRRWLPEAQALLDSVKFGGPSELGETIGQAADDGARIVKVDRLDDRTIDLTIESPAVGYAQVRLLLPTGFESDQTREWPSLYLLQGCCDDYTSWTRETDVKDLTAPTDLLVVMPAAGGGGWYTDWWNEGHDGLPMWETFHTQELPQLLERNYRANDERVAAGLSMGGYGALAYAERHPDMFEAAASFSGVPDILSDFDTGSDPVFGGPDKTKDDWVSHDVVSQAAALKGLPLFISYGDGHPGPLDATGTIFDDQEAWIKTGNDTLVAKLQELGIPATVEAYGPGTHSWPYWQQELHHALPMLLEALGED
jgi:S-formylglutathione hydrolase FrmB